MSADEIERMKRDAESHAEEDKRKRELIDARNEADQKIYNLEKMLKDAGDKVKDTDKAPLLAAIEAVKQAASGEDLAAIRRAIGDLDQAAQAMIQHLGSQQGPTPGPDAGDATGSAGKGGKDDVIDAEFEVKK